VNFELDPEHLAMGETLRRALAERAPLAHARTAIDTGVSDPAAWDVLVALGVPAAAVPEIWGGLDLGRIPLCIAAREIGYGVAAVPAFANLYFAVGALADAGGEAAARWLPRLAAGEAIAAAIDGGGGLVVGDGRATGTLAPVAGASTAEVLLVLRDDGLYLITLDQNAERRALAGIDPGRPLAAMMLNQAPAVRIGDAEACARARDRAAVYLSFEAIGCARRALDGAIDYARQRTTFGRPVAGYQAIKHKLADVWVALEPAEAHALYAAWAVDAGSNDLPLAAAAAHVAALDAALLAAREGLQIHGGYGFTFEADCHLFYRRARTLAGTLGGVKAWRERLARLLLAGASARH